MATNQTLKLEISKALKVFTETIDKLKRTSALANQQIVSNDNQICYLKKQNDDLIETKNQADKLTEKIQELLK